MEKQLLINDIKELLLGNVMKTIVELQAKKEKFERLGDFDKVELISREIEFAEMVEEIVLNFEESEKSNAVGLGRKAALFGVHLVQFFPRVEQFTIKQIADEYGVTTAAITSRLNKIAEAVAHELEVHGYVQDNNTQS